MELYLLDHSHTREEIGNVFLAMHSERISALDSHEQIRVRGNCTRTNPFKDTELDSDPT